MSPADQNAQFLSKEIGLEYFSSASLLEATSDAVLVLNDLLQIYYWNQAAEHLYGWRREDVLGQRVDMLLYDAEFSGIDLILEQLKAGKQWLGEEKQIVLSGKEIIVLSRWSVLDLSNEDRLILVVNTDITEKKSREKIASNRQRLESLGAMAAGVAHDMNNILGPMMISIEMLAPRSKEDERRLINFLQQSTKRGMGLMAQMLSFASGNVQQHEKVDFSSLLQEIGAFLEAALPDEIQFSVSFEDSLWNIYGDENQLHQLVLNLCVNARDAVEEGGEIRLRVRNKNIVEARPGSILPAKSGTYIQISVTDTGRGIEAGVLERMFDPFFSTKASGSGLGLSTAIGIVRSHGGFIDVDTHIGQGTTFKVYLPANPVAEKSQSASKILIVDDDELFTAALVALLNELGFEVLTSTTCAEGIQAITNEEPVLVMCDLRLKDGSGDQLVVHVQERVKERPPGIVLMSGNLPAAQEARVKPDYYLAKPFGVSEVVEMLDALEITPC